MRDDLSTLKDKIVRELNQECEVMYSKVKGLERNLAVQQQRLVEARNEGDLSENAEYATAQEQIGLLENRKARLLETITEARNLSTDHKPSKYVGIGSMVTIENKGEGVHRSFLVVPTELGDSSSGRIAVDSQAGAKLIGKRVGDTIFVTTPTKEINYTVLEVY